MRTLSLTPFSPAMLAIGWWNWIVTERRQFRAGPIQGTPKCNLDIHECPATRAFMQARGNFPICWSNEQKFVVEDRVMAKVQTCVIWMDIIRVKDSSFTWRFLIDALLRGKILDTIPFPETVLKPESIGLRRSTKWIDKSENREAPLGVLPRGNDLGARKNWRATQHEAGQEMWQQLFHKVVEVEVVAP